MAFLRLDDAYETVPSDYSSDYLKGSLAAELDKFGNGTQGPDEGRLQKILWDWPRDLSDSLPDALLYPVELESPGLEHGVDSERQQDANCISPGLSFLRAVEGEPHDGPNPPVGVKDLDQRGQAVAVFLRYLSSAGEFEIFLTQLSGTPGSQERQRQLYGSSARDYMDVTGRVIFRDFWFPHENIRVSAQEDCGLVSCLIVR